MSHPSEGVHLECRSACKMSINVGAINVGLNTQYYHQGLRDSKCMGEPCEHGTHGNLPDVEWVKRGRVRLFPIVGTTQLPVLTPWKPARLSLPSMSKKSVTASSSSMGTWQEKIAAAEQRVKERWEEEQRLRRRLRTSPPDDFKRRLDELMEDENGHESMWVEIQAKQGHCRWCWSHRRLKGAIEVESPTGGVFLRGSKENQHS